MQSIVIWQRNVVNENEDDDVGDDEDDDDEDNDRTTTTTTTTGVRLRFYLNSTRDGGDTPLMQFIAVPA